MRTLWVVLGDQLDLQAEWLETVDPKQDLVWMAEASEESTHVWSHQARIALFLSAMRHYREELKRRGLPLQYRSLGESPQDESLSILLWGDLVRLKPKQVRIVEPGDWRLGENLRKACAKAKVAFEILPDTSFLCSSQEFREYAQDRKGLRMEFFYREMRRRTGILMDSKGKPVGGEWNFDKENRASFGSGGPGKIKSLRFKPDAITREVLSQVGERFGSHPGSLESFGWPVDRTEALQALDHFIEHHLPRFGEHQDAMWQDEPFLHHSLLSSSLNLKLLRPLEVIRRAEKAYRLGKAPLPAVEGFIRQILGWREYVRGVYFLLMPEYLERNGLKARESLPEFYWTGDTDYECLRQAIGQTLAHGYAHHIQRLMVTGLFSLLLGVDPKQVHEWYLAVYVDAIEWVELPNTLGMSQYADGGVMASKPYIASGKYIERMSNYCESCPYDPALAEGEKACPFTTLYWDFIGRHEALLKGNPRIGAQVRNWNRFDARKKAAIRAQAERIREQACRKAAPPRGGRSDRRSP